MSKTTYSFDLLKEFLVLLELFVFGSALLAHVGELLLDALAVVLTELMVSDTCRVVLGPDLAELAPLLPLTYPILLIKTQTQINFNFNFNQIDSSKDARFDLPQSWLSIGEMKNESN